MCGLSFGRQGATKLGGSTTCSRERLRSGNGFVNEWLTPGNVLGYKAVHHTDPRSGNKESGANVKQLGRVFLAAVLAVTAAAPMPAAPAARRASLHRVSRFRGVPTFADSTLAD